MDLRSGILSTAQALGINPLDLATAISYETAGTFDPTKAGPTTQWGQHRGLIQFGEPQAKKYGVDWANPVASQLGPQGAVANYLRDTGVRPGMGLLDIYSAINAGGVGRYNRSDANNGGAPGTVRDKVEKQMAGHRQKALALLGAIEQPQQTISTISTNSPQTEAPMQDQKATGLLGSLFPNMTADRQDRLAVALSGLSMHPNQGIVQMAGQRMADRREDNKAAQARTEERQQTNRTIAWLETQAQNNPNAAQALQMLSQGVIDARGALQLAMQKPEQVKPVEVNGQLVNPMTGEVVGDYRDAPKPEQAPDSFRALEARAAAAGLRPGTPEYQRFMVEGGRANGLALTVGADGSIRFTQGNVDGPQDVTAPASPEAMISSIDGILNDPALDFSTGFLEWMQNIPGTGSARFGARAAQLNGQAFLRAFESLKGGGQITEIEGQKATEAIGRLSTAQSPKDYRDALTELKNLLSLGLERQRTGGKIESNAPGVTEVDLNGTVYRVQRVD